MKTKKTMRRLACLLAVVMVAGLAGACGRASDWNGGADPTPVKTVAPLPTVTPLPTLAPVMTATTAPIASGSLDGSFEGDVYKNDSLRFEVTFPASYTILNKSEVESLMSAAIEQMKESYDTPEAVEKAIQQSVPKVIALKHPLTYSGNNANISLLIYPDPVPASMAGDIVSIAEQAISASNQAYDLSVSAPKSTTVGGREAATAELTREVNGITAYQRQYYLIANGYMVILTLSASDQGEMNELQQIVNSFRYY